MLSRVALLLLWVTTAAGQTTVDARPADGLPYPRLIHAEVPLYPPAAWSAHLGGTVEITVTVDKGTVVDARVKRGMIGIQLGDEERAMKEEERAKLLPYLSLPSIANVKTWQFERGPRITFVVTYVYNIAGEQTVKPENPKVELEVPRSVKVTVRPFKLSCSNCGAQNADGQKLHRSAAALGHEAGDVQGSEPER